jgi:Spy/CpxP family protein refolding chaperone
MKRTVTLTLAVAALAAVPLLYAHGPGERRHAMHEEAFGMRGLQFLGHLRHLADELDLTDQQKERIHGIMKGVREQNEPYREQMHDRLKSVAETLIANPANVAGAQAILEADSEAERALKANILKGVSDALAVLTPEQRAKLGTILAEHDSELRSRRGR